MRRGVAAAGPVLALAVALTGACANQGAPPGGPIDRRPPVLIRTEPDTFAMLTDLGAGVRFVFDERISENVRGGDLNDAVTVSPQTGSVRVRHGRNTLSVEVEGGFRPGLVYRVTLLPVVRDMFGNELRDPFELVFSTGGEAPPTAVAGQVWSRINGASTRGALVHAVGADSVVYIARSDDAGIYTFRYLPVGDYHITAFEDVDRDGQVDPREPQGSVSSRVAAGDTLLIDVATLPSDTTAAVAAAATAVDSVTIALEFDDYLDAEVSTAGVSVVLERDDEAAPTVARLLHEREYGAYVAQVADSLSRLDSIDAAALPPPPPPVPDSAAAAPGAVPPPGVGGAPGAGVGPRPGRPAPPALPGSVRERGGPGRPLPARRIVALLAAPLVPDVEYRVSVGGVVNINGVPGGGGEVALRLRTPEPPPEPRGDPPPGALPDTLGVGR